MSCQIHLLHWVLLLLLLFFSATSTAQDNIGLRFNVYWGDEPGNCAGHEKTLDRWLQEAIDLTQSSLRAFDIASGNTYPSDGYKHDERTKVFLKSFWGLDPGSNSEDVDFVRGRFELVNQWLRGNRNFDESDEKPWLFCDQTELQPKSREDNAVEEDGVTEVEQADPVTGEMRPVAIEDYEKYQEFLFFKDSDGNFVKDSDGNKKPNKNIPYWSDTLKRYIMAPEILKNFCANGFTGYTNPQEEPRAMILCMDTIERGPTSEEDDQTSEEDDTTSEEDGPILEEDTILGTFVPNLVSKPSNGAFSWFKPKSSTFLYEVFHLYFGNDQTPDLTYQLLNAQDTIKDDPDTKLVS